MSVVEINESEFEKEVIKEKKIVLVDFYANWCGPCKMLGPVLENISNEIKVIKVNVDENGDLARKYGVMSIPCIILFDKGEEIKRNIGFMPEAKLRDFIK
jgi:thioredoxin 1